MERAETQSDVTVGSVSCSWGRLRRNSFSGTLPPYLIYEKVKKKCTQNASKLHVETFKSS